jgi:hypothetical protein
MDADKKNLPVDLETHLIKQLHDTLFGYELNGGYEYPENTIFLGNDWYCVATIEYDVDDRLVSLSENFDFVYQTARLEDLLYSMHKADIAVLCFSNKRYEEALLAGNLAEVGPDWSHIQTNTGKMLIVFDRTRPEAYVPKFAKLTITENLN